MQNMAFMSSKIFLFMGVLSMLIWSLYKVPIVLVQKMFQMKSLDLDLCILMDEMTLIFTSVLCIIVACVLKFSCVYMSSDQFQTRFTWLVLSFVFSMICLIHMPHFFFLLLGWDGLGITSFLLVIYYLSDSSWGAGMKTFLINRMGDSFFMLGLVCFLSKGYWDMKTCNDKNMLCGMIVLGCFTKSAQFPFSSWLPAAMAAPTPVSALVHSSTLVTAGVYLMMRFCHMFPKWAFLIMGLSGMWTLYSASLAACVEYDAKKVVAFSTLSQLGLMMVAMSLNLPNFAFFHLMTHAMFKALMFMCVGYLINKMGHFQDLRSLKGLWRSSPMLAKTLVVSSLSLMGFPFLAGFFSKELMLEKKMLMIKWVFHMLLLFSLPLTSYYSCRLCFNVLNGKKYNSVTCIQDGNVDILSMAPLYLGSIFSGVVISSSYYSLSPMYPCHSMKFFVSLFILCGALLSWKDMKINKKSLMWFFGTMCYLVPFNGSFWVKKMANMGSEWFYLLDQGMLSSSIFNTNFSLAKVSEYLHNLYKYFLSPKMSFYISSMLAFSGFLTAMFI